MNQHDRKHLSGRIFVLWIPLLLAILLASSQGVSQAETTINVGGPIFSNTTWTLANSPYLATNSVQVMNGATLTIEPGVIVRFDAGKALSISGGLVARGTAQSPITFTANTANPTPGFWGFIKFENSSADATFDIDGNYTGGSIVQHAVVEYAGSDGNNPAAIVMDRAAPFIDQSTVRKSLRDGIRVSEGGITIRDNTVQNNQGTGIDVTTSSQAFVLNNTVIGSGAFGIYASGESIIVEGNTVIGSGASGIYAYGGSTIVDGNTVRGSGSHGIDCNSATARYNRVYANAGTGISAQSCDIINNIVAYNRSGGILTYYSGTISGNQVAHNTDGAGIAIYYGPSPITYNSVVFNNTETNVAGVNIEYPAWNGSSGAGCFAYNTVVGQVTPSNSDTGGLYLGGSSVDCQVQHNNIYGNQGYELYNSNGQSDGTVDAQFNWWGTTNGSTINSEIWDFFDNGALAVTNYGNLLTAPDTAAPPAPPTGFQVAVSGNNFNLSWNANAEADIAGYRVYYDFDGAYPYEGSGATQGASGLNVGKVTSYSLSGLPTGRNIYFTVLAYDTSGDEWVGESWYALGKYAVNGDLPLRNGDFELGANGDWTESGGTGTLIRQDSLPVTPHSGSYVAWLGSVDSANELLSQTVTVPAGGDGNLHFFYQIRSEDSCGYDFATFLINDVAQQTYDLCGSTVTDDWMPAAVNVISYTGQVVNLAFQVNTDTSAVSSFLIDDVSWNASAPPTATPTATNTNLPPTVTPTATNTNQPPTVTPTATNTNLPPTVTPTATHIPPTNTPSPTPTQQTYELTFENLSKDGVRSSYVVTNTGSVAANQAHRFYRTNGSFVATMSTSVGAGQAIAVNLASINALASDWQGYVHIISDQPVTGLVLVMTPTPTPTGTTAPPTATPTSTATVVSPTHTPTATATSTATRVPATNTPTATPTATTQSPTNTPTATVTVEQEYLQVFSIAPDEGNQSGTTNVVILGQGFQGTPVVELGSFALGSVSRVSSQQLTAVVPAGLPLGTHDLLVTNPDGETVILAQAFTVVSSGPAIAEVRPSQGVASIANTINVYGFNFDAAAVVKLGNQALPTTYIGETYLQAEIPAGIAPGAYNVTVENPGNASAVKVNGYTAIEGGNDDMYSYSSQLWTDPVAPRAAQSSDVGLVVNRQGGKQVLANVPVRFYQGDPNQGGQLLGTGTILLLSPRSSVSTSAVKWTPAAPGSYTLWALIDPDNLFAESIETNNVVSRTLTVLGQSADEIAPHVDSFSVNGGVSQTVSQTVQFDTSASDPNPSSGLKSLLFQEYEYSQSSSQWVPVKNSGWLDYETARANHNWTLLPNAGVKYLQAWASDRAGNVSLYPFRAFVNYGPPTDRVGTDQVRVYRYELQVGDVLTAQIDPVSGDPDLYVWPPDAETRPPKVSNLSGDAIEDVSWAAPVAGVYQVEVYGYSASEYRLTVNITPSGRVREVVPVENVNPDKVQRTQPLIGSSNTPSNQQALPTAPTAPDAPAAAQQKVFLPAVTR